MPNQNQNPQIKKCKITLTYKVKKQSQTQTVSQVLEGDFVVFGVTAFNDLRPRALLGVAEDNNGIVIFRRASTPEVAFPFDTDGTASFRGGKIKIETTFKVGANTRVVTPGAQTISPQSDFLRERIPPGVKWNYLVFQGASGKLYIAKSVLGGPAGGPGFCTNNNCFTAPFSNKKLTDCQNAGCYQVTTTSESARNDVHG